ncbi:putative bifunctional diguanylate cyclase/phosphodiesterase [Sphingoaurantiacus capsulatus]|uniref:Bifunctional diguanylate cyclase/phosphodiesterase n=1 Tax=Sphingoaurantiacus capsulatus TaxID=1771310 RepID=A0ABV7XE15_9SPHN
MHDDNFRDRATAFAAGAGSVVLILALLATGVAEKLDSAGTLAREQAIEAIVLSVLAACVTALATMRALEPIAGALDAVLVGLREAASGELRVGFGKAAEAVLPHLVASLEVLLRRVRTSIDNIQRLALHDPVTDLPNRVHFRRIVEAHLLADPRRGALLFIDLDRFKAVNDSLGHAQGDALLGMFAARARVLLSIGDDSTTLARLAGDEFTVLLPQVEAPEEAVRIARRILTSLEESFDLAGQSVVINASIGIASIPKDGHDYETLMRNADTAMYHAKALGRNQHHAYSAELNKAARDRLQLEVQLREAAHAGQFELYFQPQIHAESGALVSAEALIRWKHPVHGLRLPGTFIDVAEDSGLIVEIGEWVVEQAIRTAAGWEADGLDCRLSCNVSPRQIQRPGFVAHVRNCLDRYKVTPGKIELEITESLVMSSDSATIDTIAQLRALGLSIAIDDFGTGYSNLARLKKLPIDRLKIDRSLIQDVAYSAEARTIVNAIVSLSHGLGYDCVAEGVETSLQADILSVIGCELLQGYSIAEPADEASFLSWAAARASRPRQVQALSIL